MTEPLPLFPLNTVLFPGTRVPLHVFEDRYRALVHALLRYDDPADRLFGSVAIREGYEVGERGGQSLHRIGCLLQLVEVDGHADGTFDVVAHGRGRLRLESLDTSGPYLVGNIDVLPEEDASADPALVAATRDAFDRYRRLVSGLHGERLLEGDPGTDPTALSWTLAATAMLGLRERQSLLEADGAAERLRMVRTMLVDEIRAITALPSLPATQVARTGWSPN